MRNWTPMWRLRRSESAPEADLRAPFEDGDHHHVCDPDPTDEQGNGSEPEEERRERALRSRSRLDRIRRPGDVDLLRMLGVRGAREDAAYRLDVLGVAAHVERRDVTLIGEVRVRGREADEHGGVE